MPSVSVMLMNTVASVISIAVIALALCENVYEIP